MCPGLELGREARQESRNQFELGGRATQEEGDEGGFLTDVCPLLLERRPESIYRIRR